MDWQHGDELGLQQTHWYYTQVDAAFEVQKTLRNGVSVYIPLGNKYVTLIFNSADQTPLTVGLYDRTYWTVTMDEHRPESVAADGVSGGTGSFFVKEIAYGPGDTILKFHASFSSIEQGSSVPVEGEIYFNATATPPPKHHIPAH